MKKLFTFLLIAVFTIGMSQGKKVSWAKKIKEPMVLMNGDTLNLKQPLLVLEGSNDDGSFKYVQLLNNFNEPLGPATSKAAFVKQKIKFFKEQDGVLYVFTKYFVINIEAALRQEEVEFY